MPCHFPRTFSAHFRTAFKVNPMPWDVGNDATSKVTAAWRFPAGRVLQKCRAQGLPDRKAGNSCTCAPRFSRRGPSPLPGHHADPCPAGGHGPRAAPVPPPAGAVLSPVRVETPLVAASGAGRGKTGRVSGFWPKGQPLSPDREDFPAGRRARLLFQQPVKATAQTACISPASARSIPAPACAPCLPRTLRSCLRTIPHARPLQRPGYGCTAGRGRSGHG